MKVILRTDVTGLGEMGELVDVKDGYARNYLIPYGVAVAADRGNAGRAEALVKQRALRNEREIAAFKEMAETISGKTVVIAARVNEVGHLYGSVGPREVAETLNSVYNTRVEGRHVRLDEHMKEPGSAEVPVRFSDEYQVAVTVEIVPEGREEAAGIVPEGREEAAGIVPEGREEAAGIAPEGREEAAEIAPEGREEAAEAEGGAQEEAKAEEDPKQEEQEQGR
jgi:large subunit ribosomal protein L9